MTGLRNIHRSIAFILLLVFSFSFTPKQYLHDLIANHADSYGKITTDHSVQAGSFQCDCNKQVVELPYLLEAPQIYHSSLVYQQQQYIIRVMDPITSVVDLRSLRGPPAVI